MKGQRVKIPYKINMDSGLSYTARRVYCALCYFEMRAAKHGGRLLKTYSEIAAATNIKDDKTIARAVKELEAAGYIEIKEHAYWNESRQILRRGTNEYILRPVYGAEKCFVWLPVKLLAAPISPATFAVLLFLLRKQGSQKRAYPSLRHGFQQICQSNGKPMPRKTICAAIEQLKKCLMLIVCHCLCGNSRFRRKKVYSMNSYMLTVWGDWTVEQAEKNCASEKEGGSTPNSAGRGGYFFGGLPVKTKITYSFYSKGKDKGVFLFSKSNKESVDISGFTPQDEEGMIALLSAIYGHYGGTIPF